MKTEKCPCHECLCLAICKHKIYADLLNCSLLLDYLYTVFGNDYNSKLMNLIKIFNKEPVYIDTKTISLKLTFGDKGWQQNGKD